MESKAAASKRKVSKPISLKQHKANRARKIIEYINDCVQLDEKIDKAFLKELGEIA